MRWRLTTAIANSRECLACLSWHVTRDQREDRGYEYKFDWRSKMSARAEEEGPTSIAESKGNTVTSFPGRD